MEKIKFKVKEILIFIFLFSALFLSMDFMAQAAEEDLLQISGEHFVVYYLDDKQFAQDVLRRAEFYYKKIAEELGYDRYSNFWTWEYRVKIMIFPTRQSFLNATDTNTWSEGIADYTEKKIVSYVWSEGFLDALLPHEIAHLIFRDFVGFKGEVPLWLDEGVAQWMEPEKRDEVMGVMYEIMEEEKAMPLVDMMRLDVKTEEDNERVYVFYVEAVSLVGFLMKEYGSKKFVEFCRQLRDGKDLKSALTFAYPTKIRNIRQLEGKWSNYVIKEGNI
jgi:hypothetical protein